MPDQPNHTGSALKAMWLIALAQLLVLSLWFSASAVSPALEVAWKLTPSQVPLLTLAVQLGFVVGALTSAVFNLPDVVATRRLFSASAVGGALVNLALLALGEGDLWKVIALRFLTGVALAGVYPVGMKAIAGWFRERRGTALGVLVGALTLGSALPQLVRGIGLPWQEVLATASALALVGALIMRLVGDGPHEVPPGSFSLRHMGRVLRNRGFRLSTAGYLGHMWELYAMWAWIWAYVAASTAAAGQQVNTPLLAFLAIAAGAPSAWYAGRVADRSGRALTAGIALSVSGAATLMTPIVFGRSLFLLIFLLAIWGGTVVADSAQFSAIVTETVDGDLRGTALTLQTALGFLLTLGSVWLVPYIAGLTSWRWAFLALTAGPAVGVLAMARLHDTERAVVAVDHDSIL